MMTGNTDNTAYASLAMTSTFPVPLVPNNLARPPVFWSAAEVKAWVEFCVQEFALSPIAYDRFDMNGKALMLLNRSDFMERAPHAGDVLFNAFKHLSVASLSGPNYTFNAPIKTPVFISTPRDGVLQQESPYTPSTNHPPASPFIPILPHPVTFKTQGGDAPVKSDIITGVDNVPVCILSPAATDKSFSDTESCHNYNDSSPKACDTPTERQPTIPAFSSDFSEQQDVDKASPDPKADCRLLWEFIYQLLMNNNRKLVYWISTTDLVFRINDPVGLAEQWGSQKNRTNMTYEKLSRALRYYYKMNIIQKVPGRKLTYQFLQPPSQIRRGQRGAKPHSNKPQSRPEDNSDNTLDTPGSDADSSTSQQTLSASHGGQCSSSSSSSPPLLSQMSTSSDSVKHKNEEDSFLVNGDAPKSSVTAEYLLNSSSQCQSVSEINAKLSEDSNDSKREEPVFRNDESSLSPHNQLDKLMFTRQRSLEETKPSSIILDSSKNGTNSESNITQNSASKTSGRNGEFEHEEAINLSFSGMTSERCPNRLQENNVIKKKSPAVVDYSVSTASTPNNFHKMESSNLKTVSTALHDSNNLNDYCIASTFDNSVIRFDPYLNNKQAMLSHQQEQINFLPENCQSSDLSKASHLSRARVCKSAAGQNQYISGNNSLPQSNDFLGSVFQMKNEAIPFHSNPHYLIKQAHSQHYSPYPIPFSIAHARDKYYNSTYRPVYPNEESCIPLKGNSHFLPQQNLHKPDHRSSIPVEETTDGLYASSSTSLSTCPKEINMLKKTIESSSEYNQQAIDEESYFEIKREPRIVDTDTPEDLSIKSSDTSRSSQIPEMVPVSS